MSVLQNRTMILHVEDEVIIAMTEKMSLEKIGYTVITASSGEQALAVFRARKDIDLVLMDIYLGTGMSGIETAELILQERAVPIFFLSSHFHPDIVEQTKKIKSYGYILKNSYISVLDTSIRIALKLFQSEKEQKESYDTLVKSQSLAHIGSWKLDLALNVFSASEEGLRLFGFPPDSSPSFSEVAACMIPSDRQNAAAVLKNALETGQPYSLEMNILKADSLECRTIISTADILFGDDGVPVSVHGINQDITERKAAENKILVLLEKNEILLKETHHRINHNLNTIYGLLILQAGTLKEPSAVSALEDAGQRVQSMMLLYDKLYRSVNMSDMSMEEYLPPLIDEIVRTFPSAGKFTVEKDIADFTLPAAKIQPLGIIVNELLSNIMKHAFHGKSGGVITVSAFQKDNRVTLMIGDNGDYLAEPDRADTTGSFGLVVVSAMAEQLNGSIRIERNNGKKVFLEF